MSENGNGNGNTAQKTARRVPGVPFSRGADPRRGHGVKGKGRPPNWLREFCDDLLHSPKCKAQVKAILGDSSHPAFAQMWKAVGERAHGKPANPVEYSGEVAIRVIREPRSLIGND